MPKMKTHSASKKRFKKTATGKFKRARAYRRHHAWAKKPKSILNLRSGTYVDASQQKNLEILMPY